jgi:probable HAF family extracellular repeat protein
MKPAKMMLTIATSLVAALMVSGLAAQQQPKAEKPRYALIDLGTFGGPDSGNNSPSVILTNEGAVTGVADTAVPDPYAPNCFAPECFVQHAFQWQDGKMTDLGALPGGFSSYTNGINSEGQVVGQSQNGLIDSVTGVPEFVAAVWQDGRVLDLGTFGGGFSLATANNNQLVVGCAFNDVLDSFTPTGVFYGLGIEPRQLRAFQWQGLQLRDLGTLGGPDACAVWINDRGQIVGASFTNPTVNPATGLPTLDPFLWEHGTMLDLGTLGGSVGLANMINKRGQIIGQSSLAKNPGACLTFLAPGCHGFLWQRGTIYDLRTLGGNVSSANWLNDKGEVVGFATTSGDQLIHASLWRNGVITDLGTLAGDCFSVALAINSEGQIVGQSFSCDFRTARAVIWDKGVPLDLNNLVSPGAGLQLTEPKIINDDGQMVASGLLPNGDLHSVVLIPCKGDHIDDENCREASSVLPASTRVALEAGTERPPTMTKGDRRFSLRPGEALERLRARWTERYHIPSPRAPRN